MQFLDAIGLAYFWEKIKTWVGQNYLSLSGGMINGDVRFGEGSNPKEMIEINSNLLWVVKANQDGTYSGSSMTYTETTSPKFIKADGTATQILMADGSVKELGGNSGIAGLDANGNVPLANLGNLDTTVVEIVTALPTSNIKRHIYLVKDSDTTNNKYAEYVYTGDISAAYDSTKWEKFGDFRTTVDLADYAKTADVNTALAKKVDVVSGKGLSTNDFTAAYKSKLDGIAPNANNYSLPLAANGTRGGIQLGYSDMDIGSAYNYALVADEDEKAFVTIHYATQSHEGIMSASDKTKLDGIDTIYARKDSVMSTIEVNANQNDVELDFHNANDDTLVMVPVSAATSDYAGVMTSSDKVKLDGISSGATADSAIPTSVIDALN